MEWNIAAVVVRGCTVETCTSQIRNRDVVQSVDHPLLHSDQAVDNHRCRESSSRLKVKIHPAGAIDSGTAEANVERKKGEITNWLIPS